MWEKQTKYEDHERSAIERGINILANIATSVNLFFYILK